ncbi:hypothetical protein DFA_04116 [Cavenderia fasciculata]|uniref:Uncharacterized protein n=1 Tax=Cavenderia fasciculata TaxID=261658 RepID=F4Q1C0_CACFS|nr:uncharacterized protein DFA_04116 [Cavenderia fasciculata]EGG18621.1 hypothetical protein DFA_04116 [Cavenderia fasciculata]|eukprot:XP_004366525.1 hypothetical protein DFA_04116 [Cavenderia fasciculata]
MGRVVLRWKNKEKAVLLTTIENLKKNNPNKEFTPNELAVEVKTIKIFDRFTEAQVCNKINNTFRPPYSNEIPRVVKKQKHDGEFADSQMPPMSPNTATSIQQTDDLDPIISRHSNYQHFSNNRTTAPKPEPTTPALIPTTTSTNTSTPCNGSTASKPQKSSTQYVNPTCTFSETESTTTPTTIPIVANTPPSSAPLLSNHNNNTMPDKYIDDIDTLGYNNNNNSMFISFYGQGNETLTIYLPLCMGETFKHTITSSGDIIVQVFRSDFCCDFTKTKRLPHPLAGTYRAYFKRPQDYGMPVLATNKGYKEMYLQEMCGFTFKREIKEISEEVEL